MIYSIAIAWLLLVSLITYKRVKKVDGELYIDDE